MSALLHLLGGALLFGLIVWRLCAAIDWWTKKFPKVEIPED